MPYHTYSADSSSREISLCNSQLGFFFFVSMTKRFLTQPLARESACSSLLSLLPAYLSTDTNMLGGSEDLRVVDYESLGLEGGGCIDRVTQQR